MRKMLLLFAVLAISVAANAAIKFYDEEKKEITDDSKLGDAVYVELENLASGDYNTGLSEAKRTKLAQMKKVVFKGTFNDPSEWNTVKDKLSSAKEYDFSAFNGNDFYNNLNNWGFISKCQGSESVLTLPDYTNVPAQNENNIKVVDLKPEILIIPNHVEKVGKEAFRQNNDIKEVYLGCGLKKIEDEAFKGMNSLEEIHFTRGIKGITFDKAVFRDNPNLKHANIPEGVLNMGDEMFMACKNLESVRIPSTVQHIGANCFSDCQLLTQITIPEAAGNPQTIGQDAFNNCTALGDIYVMARSVDKIPLIVSAPIAAGSNGGTFGNTLVNANGHNPAAGIVNKLNSDEVSDYYTTNHCMMLHYPDIQELKDFYDFNPFEEWDMEHDPAFKDLSDEEKAKRPAKYLSNTYLMPDAQYLAKRTSNNNNDPGYHPIPDGNVWPSNEQGQNNSEWRFRRENYTDSDYPNENINSDYNRRNRAGYYAQGMSNVGWRQLKVMKAYTPDVEVVERTVDDTWYTMCYPFNMTDEQLEECFSSGYDIVEFSDARIVKLKNDPTKKAMVLYFTDIAATHYIDDENNIYYSDNSLKPAGQQYRKYKRWDSEQNKDITYEYVNELSGDINQARIQAKYQTIQGTLAFAGHPYMIHPNVGVVKGETFSDGTVMQRVKGYISGVTPLTDDKYKPNVDPAAGKWHLKGDGKDRDLTQPGAKQYTKDGLDIQTQVKIELMDYTEDKDNPTHTGGYLTFVGKVVPTESSDETRGITQKIPMNSYFLGNISDERIDGTSQSQTLNEVKKYWPRFYRRANASAKYNNWTQYTAIVIPDGIAKSKLASDVWGDVDDADVSLNDFDNMNHPGDASSISEIVKDAKEKNIPVEYMDVIFNIRGQEVKRGSTDLRNLPTGVYIINGKKYFVK